MCAIVALLRFHWITEKHMAVFFGAEIICVRQC